MRIFKILFQEKTKWVDVGMFVESGKYKLTQMRSNVNTSLKEFRTVEVSFVNNPQYFDDMRKCIFNK